MLNVASAGTAYRQDAYRHMVADVMTRNTVTATERLPVEEVARLFVRLPWRLLSVVRLGRLVGVVTRTDVVRALVGPDRIAEQDPVGHGAWSASQRTIGGTSRRRQPP